MHEFVIRVGVFGRVGIYIYWKFILYAVSSTVTGQTISVTHLPYAFDPENYRFPTSKGVCCNMHDLLINLIIDREDFTDGCLPCFPEGTK